MTTDDARTADTRARLVLLMLDGMGPARLNWLLRATSATDVVDHLRRGRLPIDLDRPPPGLTRSDLDRWRSGVSEAEESVEPVLAANAELGVEVLSPLDPRWPFGHDPEPPGLLFCLGNLDLLRAPLAVSVVGTRRCTALGRTVAGTLGRDLASAGAVVVSGLALGIDGAAHRGALDEGPHVVGVVAGGLDVVYPRANRPLWEEVSQRGVLISEVPTGWRPNRWRFPARNRLIAGLSEAVVVVESHERGGALTTADEAIRRNRAVMAVPGSVLSSASRGTNALLVDGAIPVRDAIDVLAYLGRPVPAALADPSATDSTVDQAGELVQLPLQSASAPDRHDAPPPDSIAGRILAEVATGPVHLDHLVVATGLSVADVLIAVQELEAAGRVALEGSTVTVPGQRG